MVLTIASLFISMDTTKYGLGSGSGSPVFPNLTWPGILLLLEACSLQDNIMLEEDLSNTWRFEWAKEPRPTERVKEDRQNLGSSSATRVHSP